MKRSYEELKITAEVILEMFEKVDDWLMDNNVHGPGAKQLRDAGRSYVAAVSYIAGVCSPDTQSTPPVKESSDNE